jgi:hypothetical protein
MGHDECDGEFHFLIAATLDSLCSHHANTATGT